MMRKIALALLALGAPVLAFAEGNSFDGQTQFSTFATNLKTAMEGYLTTAVPIVVGLLVSIFVVTAIFWVFKLMKKTFK